jgi:hypothetical protein
MVDHSIVEDPPRFGIEDSTFLVKQLLNPLIIFTLISFCEDAIRGPWQRLA